MEKTMETTIHGFKVEGLRLAFGVQIRTYKELKKQNQK